MRQETEEKGLIKPYLLGVGDPVERQRLEERMLTDDKFFEELLVAEDELIDDYLNDTLPHRERERFDEHFLSTSARQQKLRFAVALRKYIVAETSPVTAPDASTATGEASPEPPLPQAPLPQTSFWKRIFPSSSGAHRPAWGFGLAAALLLVLLGGLALTRIWQNGRESGDEQSSPPYLVVALAPGAVRDAGEIKRVVVPANVNTVQLRLETAEGTYQSYRAALTNDEGREIFVRERLQPEASASTKTVVVNIPATLLKRGDYQLKLGGLMPGGEFENAGRYSFRVVSD